MCLDVQSDLCVCVCVCLCVCLCVCMFSLFASLLKKYTRVTEKLRNLSASTADSAANHHDNSVCVVDCADEADLVC